MPRRVGRGRRAREQVRRYGVKATLGKVLGFLANRLTAESGPSMSGPTPFAAATTDEVTVNVRRPEDVLKLQPGEYIEVKSEAEILQTLNEQGRLTVLAYLPSTKNSCNRPFNL